MCSALTHVFSNRHTDTKVRDAKPLDRQIVAAIEPTGRNYYLYCAEEEELEAGVGRIRQRRTKKKKKNTDAGKRDATYYISYLFKLYTRAISPRHPRRERKPIASKQQRYDRIIISLCHRD